MNKLILLLIGCCLSFSSQAQEKRGCCKIASGPLSLSIDLSTGRVTSFALDGREFLTSRETEPVYYGATLWPSPQHSWWPVDSLLEGSSYELVSNEPNGLHIRSRKGSGVLQFEKIFVMAGDTSVSVTYVIRNISTTVQYTGPWELIRTGGGKTFFPNPQPITQQKSNLQNTRIEKGIMWYVFDPALITRAEKIFTTGQHGWLAHTGNGLLFIKQYPDMKSSEIAPGQSEVELYVNNKATYVELETHGKFTTLHPGESLTYNVRWHLRSISPQADADNLAARVRAVIGK